MSLFLFLDSKRRADETKERTAHAKKLLPLHLQNVENKFQTSEHHKKKLIETLLGIDNILTLLLTSDDIVLSDSQYDDIGEIIVDTSHLGKCTATPTAMTVTNILLTNNISDALKMALPTPSRTPNPNSIITHTPTAEPTVYLNYDNRDKHSSNVDFADIENNFAETAMYSLQNTRARNRKRSGTIHDDDEKQLEWRYCFARNNTFIHYIFGECFGAKVFNFLYSKWTISVIAIITLIMPFAFENSKLPTHDLVRLLYHFVCMPFQMIYFTLHILSVNRKCFFIIIKNSEFWIKVLYGIQFIVAHVLFYHSSYYSAIIISIGTMIAIILLSILDGLQLKVVTKLLFGVTLSFYFTAFALYYSFISTDSDHRQKLFIISISTKQILASSTQILAVFFWKQTLLSIFVKKQCAMISVSPYLRWERNTNITIPSHPVLSNLMSTHSNAPKVSDINTEGQMYPELDLEFNFYSHDSSDKKSEKSKQMTRHMQMKSMTNNLEVPKLSIGKRAQSLKVALNMPELQHTALQMKDIKSA